jgi:hypothetical protein
MGMLKDPPCGRWKVFVCTRSVGFKLNQGTFLSLLELRRSSEGAPKELLHYRTRRIMRSASFYWLTTFFLSGLLNGSRGRTFVPVGASSRR